MHPPRTRRHARAAALAAALLAALPLIPATGHAAGTVTVAKTAGLPAADVSSLYAVAVDGRTPTVYRSAPKPRTCGSTNCDGGDYARADNRTFNWASFWFPQGTTPTVTVTKTSAAAGTPTAINVRGTGNWTVLSRDLNTRSITLRIDNPRAKLSIEFVDNRYVANRQLPLDGMLLFADDSASAVPAPSKSAPGTYVVQAGVAFDRSLAASASTVYFTGGLHDLGYWQVPPSVTRVHVAGGAYVRGAVDSATTAKAAQSGFTITGRGVLSGEQFNWRADKRTGGSTSCSYDCWEHTVKMVQVGTNRFRLHDVTVVNAPHWVVTGYRDDQITATADDESTYTGTVSDVKVLGNWGWNGDGIPALPGTTISHSFVSAFDDAFKLYSSRARVNDNTLWQMDNGAVFQLGWFGKTITDVRASRNTVLHTEWTGTNSNWGLVNYQENGGSGTISGVTIDGTRIMGPTTRVAALSNLSATQAFRSFVISDTTVDRLFTPAEIVALQGNGDDSLPRNLVRQSRAALELTVTNLRIAGVTITSANAPGTGGFDITGSPTLVFN